MFAFVTVTTRVIVSTKEIPLPIAIVFAVFAMLLFNNVAVVELIQQILVVIFPEEAVV